MKCISLWQPWAELLASGAKKIETRSYLTKHRGLLLIHASKKWRPSLRRQCCLQPFCDALGLVGSSPGPHIKGSLEFGKIIAIGDLVDCVRITKDNIPSGRELCFGDYREGRYMWRFAKITKLPIPFPLSGQQKVFNVSNDVASKMLFDNLNELLEDVAKYYKEAVKIGGGIINVDD